MFRTGSYIKTKFECAYERRNLKIRPEYLHELAFRFKRTKIMELTE